MEGQIEVVTSEVQKSTETALTILDTVKSLTIITVDDYQFAQMAMKEVKDRIKEIEEIRMGQTRPLDESKKKIMDFFRVPLQKLNDAKEYLNRIMIKWVDEEKVKERELQRKFEEEGRKRAEEEALQRALEAEKAGDKQEAEQIISEPVYVPPIKVVSEIPKSKESHIRETWSAEGFDLMATIMAIGKGTAPLQAVQYDMPFLNKQAISYKQALNIPGVRAVSKKTQI